MRGMGTAGIRQRGPMLLKRGGRKPIHAELGRTEQKYQKFHSICRILIYQEVIQKSIEVNDEYNEGPTHHTVIDCIVRIEPYETFRPFVRFDPTMAEVMDT